MKQNAFRVLAKEGIHKWATPINPAAAHQEKTKQANPRYKDFPSSTLVATSIAFRIGGFIAYRLQHRYTKGILFIIPLSVGLYLFY